ncbi:hypothetical protein PF005_g18496 [Phytophthora fragariae]|uniref:Uncharacterized protein n=1 Tax=Phytophthora fragariae TaxID=53985 RepID=A0A6A3DMF7_9STRA|nr:hypothetical protein PF003_g27371 [Phytophthora fragariae]KAE8922499.1 hypothetical protein PF009_g27238 [Phytophthora fragariae]KAE8972457.1 hypothetical protein PF011_g25633 [Phytophthora fragariae]KAE9071315.1 hypothetical protein PF007_g26602 [Phytophthora fragariae]KAE9072391.1 hypothetical protein PF010_g25504 [Phytophthora fragariae]
MSTAPKLRARHQCIVLSATWLSRCHTLTATEALACTLAASYSIRGANSIFCTKKDCSEVATVCAWCATAIK